MSYASIKEVYGDDFIVAPNSNQPLEYKSVLNNNTKPLSEKIEKEVENFVSDYSQNLENYDNFEELYDEGYEEEEIIEDFDNDNDNDNDSNCGHLIEHLSKCPKCRLYLEKHFGKQDNIQKYIKKKREDQLLDIAIYIATGIFILFLLDIFVRLGKFVN